MSLDEILSEKEPGPFIYGLLDFATDPNIGGMTSEDFQTAPHAPRTTHHPSRITFQDPIHDSRITPHFSISAFQNFSVFPRVFVLIENGRARWDNPIMTVIADAKRRVTLPDAEPGDAFDVERAPDGSVLLRKRAPAKPKVTYIRKDGLLLAHTDEPISLQSTLDAIEKYAL